MMKPVRKRLYGALLASALLIPAIPALPSPAYAATKDITAFGATGGDASDDITAILNAINSASAGDTVYFPSGTYYVSGPISAKSGIKLIGQSRDTTIVKYTGVSDGNIINLNGMTNVEVAQLTLDGNGNTHVTAGIWGEPGGGHNIHHNRIKDLAKSDGFAPFGILMSASDNVTIADNDFLNIGVNSEWGGAIRVGWNSNYPQILRNTIANTGRGGIFVNDGSEGAIVRNNVITGSGKHNDGLGIELHTNVNHSLVEDNQVDHWLSVVRSQYNAIRRNTIHPTDGTVAGIGLEIMTDHSVTTDNFVDGGHQVGMQQSPGTGYQYWGYNTVQNMVMWGMQLQGEGTGFTEQYQYFYKNVIKDNPAGNPAAAYPGYDGNAVRIHGNSKNLTFDSNQILNNGRKAIEITGAAGTDRLSFINNTITGNAGPSIDQYPSSAADLEWSGNTVSGNGANTQLTSRGFSDAKPAANFSASTTNISLGQPVTFTNSSTDNGTIVENLWDFGEGLPVTTLSPTYTYEKAGTYRVTLVVWDNTGRASLKQITVTVTAGPPDTQAPTAPTGLASPSKTDTSVTLNWTASTDNVGVASYEIYRGSTLCGTSATASFVCTGLAPSTAYSFTVKAKDAAGNVSGASGALSVTTSAPDTQAPTAPTSLTSPSKTDTSVNLAWTAATDNFGVASYDVYRDGTLCGNTATTSFTCSGLLPSTAYSFTVKAKDAAGNVSAASGALSVTTQALITGTITREYWTGVPGNNISDNNFNTTPTGTASLTSLKGPSNWGDNYADRIRGFLIPTTSGAYTFAIAGDNNSELWLSTDSNPANKSLRGSIISYTNEDDWSSGATSGSINLVAGQKYYIEVLHKEASGGDHVSVGWTGPGISTRVVVPGANLAPYYGTGGDTQAPTAPTGLTSPSKTAASVSLSWTASSDNVGVTGYDVFQNGTLAGSTTGATTFNATGLTANTAYSFTVKAKDAAGNVSAASSAISVTTNAASDTQAPTAPSGLASPSKTAASVDLSWTASTDNVGVTGYDVYYGGTTLCGSSASTTFTCSGLTANTAYSFTVKAKDAAGNVSAASGALSVTTNAVDTQAPTAPTGLASPSKTSSSVTLSWTASTDNVGVTGYDVYRGGTTLCGSTATTSFTCTGLNANTAYSFTVKAKDAAGNVSSASGALSVTTNATTTGSIVREYWTNVSGNNISDNNFSATPTGTAVLTSLKGPTSWGDNYADRIRGYIVPSTTGAYTFAIAGDNNSQLWLSTDANPANKVLLASIVDWTNEDDWSARPDQVSGTVNLVAGQMYYVEVLHKEANGGDHVSVGWTGPGISTRVVVPGANLAPY